MLKTVLAKFNRTITAFVGATALVATTFAGALPASATVPTPNANSNAVATSVNANWTVGQPSTIDLSNTVGAYWEAIYEIEKDPNSAFALIGRTLSIESPTPAGMPAGFSTSGNLNISYYNTNGYFQSGWAYSGSGPGNNTVVPDGTTKIRLSVNIYLNAMNRGATYPNVALNPTFTIKTAANGATATALTRDDTFPTSSAATTLRLVERPQLRMFSNQATWTGRSNYSSVYTQVATCVDLTGRSAGDQLTVSTVVDGAVSTNGSVSFETLDSSANGGSGRTITLTSNQINSGEMLKISHSQSGFSTLTSGNHSTAVSVTLNGTEVSATCVLKAPGGSAPVLSYDASNMNGPAGLFLQVSGSAYASGWNWKIYRASDNTLLSEGSQSGNSSPRPLYAPCGMNGCTPVAPAGVPVYAKVQTQKVLIYSFTQIYAYSALSAPSNTSQFPNPWLTVSAPSAGSLPGDARLVGENIDFAAADLDPDMMMNASAFRAVSDGKNGVLKSNLKEVSGCNGPGECVVDVKLFRIGASGIDTTFANSGAAGVSLARYTASAQGGAFPENVNSAWFGARNKWHAVIRDSDYSEGTPLINYKLVNGTFSSSSVSSAVDVAMGPLIANGGLCAGFTSAFISPISAPTSAPLYMLNCNKSGMNGPVMVMRLVTVSNNGTVNELVKLNEGDGTTDTGFTSFAFVSNINASAANDVALTLLGYSVNGANIVTRKSVQVKVNGTANAVNTSPYSSSATTTSGEKRYIFSQTAAGTTTTGLLPTTANGVTTYKLATLDATGTITEGDNLPLDVVSGMDGSTLAFVPGQDVGTSGKIQMTRNLGSTKVASVTVDLDTKDTDTGEVVSYTNSTDSRVVRFFFLDAQGRVNWMFSSAASKLSLIRWNGLSGGGALPDGVTITSVSTKFITNAAAVVTINGTGLTLASASTRISVVGAGLNRQAVPSVKTATRIVLTVEAGTTAGDIQVNAPLALGDATLATLTRVGATKQDQAITDTNDVTATWSGVSNRTTASFPATTDKGLATTIRVDKPAICSVSGQTVTMNAAGTCLVTVASAGDLGTNAASQTTTITVAKRTHQVSDIVAALTAAAGTWAGSNQTITLPSLLTSVGLAATVTVTPATVCSISGAVITIRAAGTCAVAVAGAADAGTDAIARTVTNVIIAKGNLNLEVDSTATISNNPAASNNTFTVDWSIATGAISDAEPTFASSNEDVCTVDENGVVTGVSVGTCVVTTDMEAGPNWLADEATTTVTVQEDNTTPIPDALPEVGDGNLTPKPIANNRSAFVATNDSSLLVRWDKAAGLLTLQSRGVYTGFIRADVTFSRTVNGVTTSYTCTNVFGNTTAMPSRTAAQRKAALRTKVFTAASAACRDASTLRVPGVNGVAGDLTSNFRSIARIPKVAGNATTVGTRAHETAAATALRGFTGEVSIKVTRYRAWPTSMSNQTPGANAKKIPATVRTTVVNLQ